MLPLSSSVRTVPISTSCAHTVPPSTSYTHTVLPSTSSVETVPPSTSSMEAVPPPTSSAEAVSSTVHMAPPSSSSAHSLSSSASSLQDLHNLLALPNNSWCDQTSFPLTAIKLCKISCQPTCSKQPLVVTHCLTVNDSLHWSLFVHDHEVKQGSCAALASIPPQLNAIEFSHLLDMIDRLHVCSGHPDNHFVSMVSSKKGVLKSCSGSTAAILDSFAPVQLNGEHFSETVRTSACELLVHESKCPSCKSYRAVLRAMYSRYNSRDSSRITETTSHTNERYLNTPEKKNRQEKSRPGHGQPGTAPGWPGAPTLRELARTDESPLLDLGGVVQLSVSFQ